MKPQFNNFQEFIDMGGYGQYVFTAFALAIFLKVILVYLAFNSEKKALKRNQSLEVILNEKK